MDGARWEWTLEHELTIAASADRRTESVWLGSRLISRAVVGTRPAGHDVLVGSTAFRGAERVRVVYSPGSGWELRVDEMVVPPTRRIDPPSLLGAWFPLIALGVVGLLMTAMLGTVLWGRRRVEAARSAKGPVEESLDQRQALSGFVVHHPSSFVVVPLGSTTLGSVIATSDMTPSPVGVVLSSGAPTEARAALTFSSALSPPDNVEAIHRAAQAGFAKTLAAQGLDLEEATESGRCLGQRGLVSRGTVRRTGGEGTAQFLGGDQATTSSCTFARGGYVFHFFRGVGVGAPTRVDQLSARIFDATEVIAAPAKAPATEESARPRTSWVTEDTELPRNMGRRSYDDESQEQWRPPVRSNDSSRSDTTLDDWRTRSEGRTWGHARPASTRSDYVYCDAQGACQRVGSVTRRR